MESKFYPLVLISDLCLDDIKHIFQYEFFRNAGLIGEEGEGGKEKERQRDKERLRFNLASVYLIEEAISQDLQGGSRDIETFDVQAKPKGRRQVEFPLL